MRLDVTYGDTVGEDGVWVQLLKQPIGTLVHPTLFLDRDGVIVDDVGYLHKVQDTVLIPGSVETIRRANLLGLPVVIVTNQSGIGRGIFGWQEFSAVQEKMLNDLSDGGAYVNAVLACPFHVEANPPWNNVNHPDRKPAPGMLLRAGKLFSIDYTRSWIIGDHANDIRAGKSAGIQGGLLVASGHGSCSHQRENARACANNYFCVNEGNTIIDALHLIPLFN